MALAAHSTASFKDFPPMPVRLVALDEGPDILIDEMMIVVGRHPNCDARFGSLRLSRHHCCLTQEHGAIVVRDLGSTNGIRINGERVQIGRLQVGDLLSLAHLRFRVESGPDPDEDRPSPAASRPWISDLLSRHSRIQFISRN
jgi:pSer/pThr/pTyr-binding forkhead associated (FHA) protein